MRIGNAVGLLINNYLYATNRPWIKDKVAWALYQTWKEADNSKADTPQTDLVNDSQDLVKDLVKQTDCDEETGHDCPWK